MSHKQNETGIEKAVNPADLSGTLTTEQVEQMQSKLLIAQQREAEAREFEKMLRITTREASDKIEDKIKDLRSALSKASTAVREAREVQDAAVTQFGDHAAEESAYFNDTIAAIEGVGGKATLSHETQIDYDEDLITVTESLVVSDSPNNYRAGKSEFKNSTEYRIPGPINTLHANVTKLEERRTEIQGEVAEWEQKLANMPFLKERMIDWADAKELSESGAGDKLTALQEEMATRLGLGG